MANRALGSPASLPDQHPERVITNLPAVQPYRLDHHVQDAVDGPLDRGRVTLDLRPWAAGAPHGLT